jgi:hypothetical protein
LAWAEGVRARRAFVFASIYSPVFDAPQAVELLKGRPASRRQPVSRRAQGGSMAKSEASIDAPEHGGTHAT